MHPESTGHIADEIGRNKWKRRPADDDPEPFPGHLPLEPSHAFGVRALEKRPQPEKLKKIIDKEQELFTEELKNSRKPEEIAKKISLGKMNKFKNDNSLMTQDWIMEPKKKVKDIIKELNTNDLKISEFVRLKIGE